MRAQEPRGEWAAVERRLAKPHRVPAAGSCYRGIPLLHIVRPDMVGAQVRGNLIVLTGRHRRKAGKKDMRVHRIDRTGPGGVAAVADQVGLEP